jgi:uncharacterized protein
MAAGESMIDRNLQKRISELDDVELVRMLTLDAKDYTPEAISIAKAEASRRGVPIDAAFIPSVDEAEVIPLADEVESVSGSRRFEAGGAPILCAHCRSDEFSRREILLNTRGLTFLKLDWLNRSATVLACAKCGLIQLFAVSPAVRDDGA